MSFQDRLAAAKAVKPRSMVIETALQSESDDRLAQLERLRRIAEEEFKADTRLGAVNPAVAISKQIDELSADAELERIRVYKMTSDEWAELVSLHPFRPDVPADKRFGYNTFAIAKPAAKKCAVLLEGDEEVPLTDEQWDDLFKVAPGLPSDLADALFTLNVWEPGEAVDRAKKAFARRAVSERKSSSQPD